MARLPKDTDFTVPVEDVGTFTFGRRTLADEIKIQVEYAKMIDGAVPTEWLSAVCGWLATLRVLTVRAPANWDLDNLDPLDPSTYAKLSRVHEQLTEKERSFRGRAGQDGKAGGEVAVSNAGVSVSATVQPEPTGSAVS